MAAVRHHKFQVSSKSDEPFSRCGGGVEICHFLYLKAVAYNSLYTYYCTTCDYPHPLCRSTWVGFGVGRIFESVCLSVCPQHNSTRRMAIANGTCVSFCNQSKAQFVLSWVRPWDNRGKCYNGWKEDSTLVKCVAECTQYPSRARTVVRECCKDDCESLWKSRKYGLTDRLPNLHR